jgi:putative CocE/NonD family hydrolase
VAAWRGDVTEAAAELAGAAVGRLWRLPPRRNRVLVRRGVPVPTRDGVTLRADHYAPAAPGPHPTVLMRGPYGRGPRYGLLGARPYAERGYHVLLVSSRGTYGSGGEFTPAVHEAADGQDVVAWLRDQPWFDGRLATVGASYLGFTQWALALDPPPELTAMVVQIGLHDMAEAVWAHGAFHLYDSLMWADLISRQELHGTAAGLLGMATAERRLAAALDRQPLHGALEGLGGAGAPWYDGWVGHPSVDDPFWAPYRFGAALDRVTAPTLLFTGWHDIFVPQAFQQYAALRARDVPVALTVGPWTHFTMHQGLAIREALTWLDTHTAGRAPLRRAAPVRVFLGGARRWTPLPEWPPPTTPHTWHLAPGGRLTFAPIADGDAPAADGAVSFRYDPADPTPSVGGRLMAVSGGARDNAPLESRDDVIAFTTPTLPAPLDVYGSPVVELVAEADGPHADLFVRVCDVDGDGRSVNVTDTLLHGIPAGPAGPTGLPDPAGPVRITLMPTAHRFRAGHRIRLLVAGGAYPRFARNPGTGEPIATARSGEPVTCTVHTGGSRLLLPVGRQR